MRKSLFMAVLAMGLLSGCQNETENVIRTTLPDSKVVVTASLDTKTESRTSLQEDGNNDFKILWSADDKLGIFYYSSTAHNKFKLTDGAGESNATFESEGTFKVESGTEGGTTSNFACVGYYPYAENTTATQSTDGSYTIGMLIAVNQTYANNSFGVNNFPMLAVSDNLNFSFKNAASVLRMPLKGSAKIVKATLTSESKKIAGPYSVKMTETDGSWTPSIDGDGLGIATDGSSMIVLECGEGVQLDANTATNFLFVIPPGVYAANDLTVKFYDNENKYYSTTITAENTFDRSEVLTFTERTYQNPQNAGIAEANQALKAGVENVDVTISSTDENPKLELPATTSDNPTNISFEPIPSGKKVIITASTESNNQEAKNVNLSVPASQEGYDFEINLPNSTVTLDANGESATYDDVTASTADETLIISQNVTVNTLKIKKGHVRVHGSIGNISREGTENGDVTYIIKEDGASITGTVGEGCVVVSAAEYDLIVKFKQGGTQTIVLESGVELTQPLTLTEGNVILDLNSKTITASNGDAIVVTNNAQLTITGNGIVQVKEGANGCAVWAHHGGQVTIENGTFSTNDDADGDRCDCIYAGSTADMSSGTIIINDGTFKYDGTNEEGHKFLLNKKDNTGSTITVNGGVFYKFNPAVSYGEPNAPVDFVAETSIVVETAENVFEVLPSEDGIVTLSKDIALYSPIEINKGNITLNMNGKTITASNGDAIVVTNNAQLTITGNGTVQVQKGANGCAVWAHHGGQVTIENGTFSTNDDADGDRCDCIYAGSTADMSSGTIIINGGTFKYDGENTEGHKFLLNKKDNTGSTITVNGGVFYKFNPAVSYGEPNAPVDFVAETSIVVETAEDVFEVLPSENGVVTLSKDIALCSPIEINKGNITFNLNGKTVTASKGDAIVVTNDAQLTITGNGIVQVQKGANGCAVWAHHGGQVTIENGTFSTNDDADGDRCDCIYAGSTADMSSGTIIINGGTFKYDGENAEGHKFLLNKKDNTESSISVTGGKYYKFDPAISYGEPNAPVNFVAEGYKSTESEEEGVKVYTVSKE